MGCRTYWRELSLADDTVQLDIVSDELVVLNDVLVGVGVPIAKLVAHPNSSFSSEGSLLYAQQYDEAPTDRWNTQSFAEKKQAEGWSRRFSRLAIAAAKIVFHEFERSHQV